MKSRTLLNGFIPLLIILSLALYVLRRQEQAADAVSHSNQYALSEYLRTNKDRLYYIFTSDNNHSFNYDDADGPDKIVIKNNEHYDIYWLSTMKHFPKGFTLKELSQLSDEDIIKKLHDLDTVSIQQAIKETSNGRGYASKPAKGFSLGFKLYTNADNKRNQTKSEDLQIMHTDPESVFETLADLKESKRFSVSKSTYNGLIHSLSDGAVRSGIFFRTDNVISLDQPFSKKEHGKASRRYQTLFVAKPYQKELQALSKSLEVNTSKALTDVPPEPQGTLPHNTTPTSPWDLNKSEQLSQFMEQWGAAIGQTPYINVTEKAKGTLITNEPSGTMMMDVAYSNDGLSNAEYTIVATYEYRYNIKAFHRYHFAIKQDGKPAILYSGNAVTVGNAGYYVMRETDNIDLKNGYAAILKTSV